MKIRSNFIVAFSLFIIAIQVQAQSGHYWTQQYGTRSMLLSGSVIGGVSDLGAVYYNPARLGQIENPAFLISADVYEWNTLSAKDAFGNNKNVTQSNFGGVPSLAAGTFKIPFLKKHAFAWAILVRTNTNLNFSYKDEVYDDVLEEFPGTEIFGAEIILGLNPSESWTSLSWSYPLNDKLSIGASGYFSIAKQRRTNLINLQALTESNQVVMYRFNKSCSFSHYSILGKLGISYTTSSVVLGLTFLTPRIKLKGNGSYQYEEIYTGIEGVSENPNMYTTSYQSDLSTEFKSPWAIGIGYTQSIGKSKIHLSSEWYNALPNYTIMHAVDHYNQSNGDTLQFKLTDQFNSVLNAGVGVELYLNEKISFYTSFSTDFSALPEDVKRFSENNFETSNSIMKADFYHLGGGFVLTLRGANITLGLTHTGAVLNIPRPFTFPEDDDEEILNSEDPIKVDWDRWRFVFSFSMPFLKDVQKKVEEKLGF